MEILFVLVPLSVLMIGAAAAAFVWAARDGQLDAGAAEAARALRDEEPPAP